jgi:hypothetical protein
MPAMMEMRRALPEQFVMNCTGTSVHFDSTAVELQARPPAAAARRT